MLTFGQIAAIVGLLLAFDVPQSKVDEVQSILEHRQVVTEVVQTTDVAVQSKVVIDCTPTLVASLSKDAGSFETGIDFTFHGTSTVPVGCSVNKSAYLTLQTPSTLYKGYISDWVRNGDVTQIEQGFVFKQGWGTGSRVTSTGQFTWSVASTSITISL